MRENKMEKEFEIGDLEKWVDDLSIGDLVKWVDDNHYDSIGLILAKNPIPTRFNNSTYDVYWMKFLNSRGEDIPHFAKKTEKRVSSVNLKLIQRCSK